MAKLAKPVVGRKALENVNEEAVASSPSGFVSGEDDAVTSTKGKGRGRKAKKELAIEVDVAMSTQKVVKSTKSAGTGRGRKKLSNEEEKTAATPAEDTIVEKKSSSTKVRGKKSAELATVEGQLLAEDNATEENGVVKALPKRGRKAAATKVEESATNNNSGPVVTAAPATKGRGRGKKDTTIAVEESAATQLILEEPSKPKKQKKSVKDIPIDEEKQNGESSEVAVKDVKKRATKSSKVKVEQIESSEASETIVEPKKSKARSKAPKQGPKEEQNGELLEKSVEKPVKASAANKRKANKKTVELENAVEASEALLKVEADEEDAKPSPKKKSKKEEPKEKKPEETKPRARSAKSAQVQEQLENGVIEKEKPQSRKRGAAKNIVSKNTDEADGGKPAKSKKTAGGALVNTTVTKYNKEDFKLQTGKDGVESFNLKISSWNVAGLRSWLTKDGLRFLDYELPDIFCLQEIKCTIDQLPEQVARIPGYHPYWLCMPGGYAGVAIYSKIMPINVEYGIGNKEFDSVGRMITAEYEKFFLINVYVPNSGRKLVNLEARMRWEKLFQEYVKRLDAIKPVIICGDMNVSHQAIDLANPKTNTRSAGFTQEERDKMTELLALGFIDTFRHLYPDRTAAYTYWTYMANARSRNVGWRLDYFIVSERFTKRVLENCIRSQVMGSDHCPITLFLKM